MKRANSTTSSTGNPGKIHKTWRQIALDAWTKPPISCISCFSWHWTRDFPPTNSLRHIGANMRRIDGARRATLHTNPIQRPEVRDAHEQGTVTIWLYLFGIIFPTGIVSAISSWCTRCNVRNSTNISLTSPGCFTSRRVHKLARRCAALGGHFAQTGRRCGNRDRRHEHEESSGGGNHEWIRKSKSVSPGSPNTWSVIQQWTAIIA